MTIQLTTQGAAGSIGAPNTPMLRLSTEDQARLARLNRHWNDDIVRHRAEVLEIYAPLIRRMDKDGIAVFRDIGYGADPRQRLDLFVPPGAEQCQILIFVHGGAFTRGSKSAAGDFYDNVAYWFARQGFVAVNVEYRLAPAAPFPAGAQDVGRAVAWVAENIATYGGDPGDVVLMGHSAGGCHVASYLLDPLAWDEPYAGVSATVFVSARLRLECLSSNPNASNVVAYCSADPAVLERCSPVNHAERCRWPVFIAIAEYENRYLDAYGLEFAARLAMTRGQAPRMVQMQGHNHSSIIAHFNSGEDRLGREILAFLAANKETPR
ncbi:acetyl esterase/lipase [Bradyrhizobium sp. cir1]|uniref:alpha/beta hydrolase n=1 Tax=Bradyrhizobium sp. cir1 TaxID=1445730 RepID=UPI0017FC79ED|nr:alpha/beta hydrolase [Bradyrhizobium sp. cir1]MBB4369188.1 acetyl esterase/lipase [Bradyrhizobium sp. cir1]